MNEHPLVVAYHTIYDVKDAAPPVGVDVGSSARYVAYETLGKLAELMTLVGVEVPNRSDAFSLNHKDAT